VQKAGCLRLKDPAPAWLKWTFHCRFYASSDENQKTVKSIPQGLKPKLI